MKTIGASKILVFDYKIARACVICKPKIYKEIEKSKYFETEISDKK